MIDRLVALHTSADVQRRVALAGVWDPSLTLKVPAAMRRGHGAHEGSRAAHRLLGSSSQRGVGTGRRRADLHSGRIIEPVPQQLPTKLTVRSLRTVTVPVTSPLVWRVPLLSRATGILRVRRRTRAVESRIPQAPVRTQAYPCRATEEAIQVMSPAFMGHDDRHPTALLPFMRNLRAHPSETSPQ
jgi:hypothetical protein